MSKLKLQQQKQVTERDIYSWIRPSAKAPLLIILIAASVVLTIALSSIGKSLKNNAATYGIISFEFAGSADRGREIVNSWAGTARDDAFLSTGLDYLYLCIYPIAISLACNMMALRLRSISATLAKFGMILSPLVIAALAFDAIENYALIRMLTWSRSELWPKLAWWCAAPKFTLVIAGLLYLLVGLACMVVARTSRSSRAPA